MENPLMKKWLHKIAHILELNHGRCHSFYSIDGKLMMSFKCLECGKLDGVHCIDDVIDRELAFSLDLHPTKESLINSL